MFFLRSARKTPSGLSPSLSQIKTETWEIRNGTRASLVLVSFLKEYFRDNDGAAGTRKK